MRRSLITWTLLLLYLVVLLILTLRPQTTLARPMVNLVPFAGLQASLAGGRVAVLINLTGNLVAFMPLGFLMAVWLPQWRSLLRICLLGAGLSLLIEVGQFVFSRRVSDIDDVLINTLGAAVGYLSYQLLSHSVGSQARWRQALVRR